MQLRVAQLTDQMYSIKRDVFDRYSELFEEQMEVHDKMEVQSTDEAMTPMITETQEVLEFADRCEGDQVGESAIFDEVVEDIDTGDFGLADFLSRPVRIASYSIGLGEAFNQRVLQPWYLFLNKDAIRRKIDNYAYIQCDLKIKVVVNSTPFIYGCYGMSYKPLTAFAQHMDYNAVTDNEIRVPLSQRPTILIESHKNKGGELDCPFLYYKNWLPLTEIDTQEMGELTLYPFKAFQSANGLTTQPVGIVVYAWAENVKLAGNTVDLAVQAADEYGKGPVSRVASTVAGISKYLEKAPVIGKFARATTIGARAIGSIASLFGFTNPPVIENAMPMKDVPFHAFSSSQISVPIDKLTLDPKNELTVDPTTVGLSAEDELAISYIAQKPSFMRVVDWEQSDLEDYSLFRANVTPTWSRTIGSAPSQSQLDVPMGYISRLFSNWRGDLIIRVMVVRSQYHQGRLRISYDPVGNIFANADTETVVNTKILDIQADDYVEFRIPYMAPQSWLRVRPGYNRDTAGRADSNSGYDADYHNGRFEVRVLNPLTGPNATSNVGIVFFCYAADNFELANPSEVVTPSSVFQVQSVDTSPTLFEMGKCTPRPANGLMVNFGEDVRSMRTLLRRTTFHGVLAPNTQSTFAAGATRSNFSKLYRNIYPVSYGFDPLAPTTANGIVVPGATPANFVNITPYTWLTAAFLGQRGSMMYSFDSLDATQDHTYWGVTRLNEPFVSRSDFLSQSSTGTNDQRKLTDYLLSGVTGMSLQNEKTQTGLQVLVPFMNKYRFVDTDPSKRVYGSGDDDSENNNFVVEGGTIICNSGSASRAVFNYAQVAEHHCIGADFSLLYFLNVPRRWIYTLTLP